MIPSETAPIFIMSSERSGSNLLRTLLANHSNIAAPVAAQYLPVFTNLALYYSPLSDKKNACLLMEDMLTVVNHPYYGWELSLDLDELYEKYKPAVFLDFYDLFYREKQAQEGKKRFACKENRIFDFAFPLMQYYGQAKFIYLYRDSRDYAASFLRIPIGPSTPYDAAMHWLREQEKCAALIEAFHFPVHAVQYEALITDPATVMTGVLHFLEEPVEEGCFQVNPNRGDDVSWNIFWQNLRKPIMQANFGKYRGQFNVKTINLIETVTKDYMLRLGYDLDTPANWRRPRFFQVRNAFARRLARRGQKPHHSETMSILDSRNALIRVISQERKKQWRQRVKKSRQAD